MAKTRAHAQDSRVKRAGRWLRALFSSGPAGSPALLLGRVIVLIVALALSWIALTTLVVFVILYVFPFIAP